MRQFDVANELKRLASILDTKANTADALAAEYAKAKRLDDWQKEITNGKNARHFRDVCLEGWEKLRAKGSPRGDFTAPTWEAVIDYAKKKFPNWPADEVQSWFNHFVSVGWMVGNKPMKCWERAADNGFLRWKRQNPGRASGKVGTAPADSADDPPGWAEWLKKIKRPYIQHRYEQEFLRKQFAKLQQ